MVAAEIDWGITTGPGMAVQFQLSGNSPVAFSQIVAMQVDNTSNAVDAQFMFPDSSYTLVVPAYAQLTTPVFTNALQFYVYSPGAVTGDRTLFQCFNSVPPPVAVQRSEMQEVAAVAGILLNTNHVVPLIPAGVNGTVEAFNFAVNTEQLPAGALACNLNLVDGAGATLWIGIGSEAQIGQTVSISPVRLAFQNGLNLSVTATTLTSGYAIFNIYYGVP
jgi:hypothetical protein